MIGNECQKLLDNIEILRELIEKYAPAVTRNRKRKHDQLGLFLDAFRAFKKVVDGCFGKSLLSGWEQSIREFEDAYVSLGISITTKVHLVTDHVEDFCKDNGCGLSAFSEHAFESLHRDFLRHWERHKVKDTAHPDFGKRLKKTTCEYNAGHL